MGGHKIDHLKQETLEKRAAPWTTPVDQEPSEPGEPTGGGGPVEHQPEQQRPYGGRLEDRDVRGGAERTPIDREQP